MVEKYLSMETDNKEERKFYEDTIKKIERYYKVDKSIFNFQPHARFRNLSENMITRGLEEKNDLFIGIGTELLMKAIILDCEWEFFIQLSMKQKLGFNKCKDKLEKILSPEINDFKLKRILDVLDLIQIKRNNVAHSGFSYLWSVGTEEQICKVLVFLYKKFFEKDSQEIISILEDYSKKDVRSSGMTYEPINF
jgi:uncharacterized membrane protein YheB (UPF0754 family)